MAKRTIAVLAEFSAITGIGSGQTEELQITVQKKEWDIDEGLIDNLPVENITIHRSGILLVKKTHGTSAFLNVSYHGAQIFQLSTDDYNWFTESYYTLFDIESAHNSITSILGN